MLFDGAKVEEGTGFSVIFFFQPQVEVERASSLPIRLLSLQPSLIEPAQGYSITNEINRTYSRGGRVEYYSRHVSSERFGISLNVQLLASFSGLFHFP